jgi:hypothetical protein
LFRGIATFRKRTPKVVEKSSVFQMSVQGQGGAGGGGYRSLILSF